MSTYYSLCLRKVSTIAVVLGHKAAMVLRLMVTELYVNRLIESS